MSAILAQRKGEYVLAWFAPFITGCNLSLNRIPLHDAEQFHLSQRGTYVWSHAPLDGITFYPEIRYKGMRVCVWNGWHPDSAEPLLNVMSGSWHAYPEEPAHIAEARKQELLAEGWFDGGYRDGIGGYVHVDKLEKLEGPPPPGAFGVGAALRHP